MSRVVCWFRGHVHRMIALPEDIFGYTSFSRIECARCGAVLTVGMTPAMQIRRLTDLLDECRACRVAEREAE